MNLNAKFTPADAIIGQTDDIRRQRLIAIAGLDLMRGGTVNLRWPSADDVNKAAARRDLEAWDPARQMLTLQQQIRPHSAILRAGASSITLDAIQTSAVPSIDRSKRAQWVGSSADVAPTLDLVESTPNRLSCFIKVSRQLLATSAIVAAGYIESQLLSALGASVDHGALNGTGTDEPIGLLANPDLLEHNFTTAYNMADITAMEQAVAAAHGEADPAAMAWIADPATRTALRTAPRISGKETPIWTDGPKGGPLGYQGIASPWAPAGTLIYGHMGDLLVIQSSVIELCALPSRADAIAGFITLVATGFIDVVTTNPGKSFIRGI